MPSDKDVKRRIRARMEKTGESYTAARSHLLKTRPAPIPADYVERAGMSDATIRAKTGRTWRQWVRTLDEIGAPAMSHREIAKWVHDETGLDWWAQTITVGYERIRGMRDTTQRRGGAYEASKSRTFPVSAAALFRAFADDAMRRRWLDVDPTVRSATAPKSLRITWPDDTDVSVWITPKGESKASVAIQHGKLASREQVAEAKERWAERLDRLAAVLRE